MVKTLDLSTFVEDNLDSEVLAYEHALDLAYLFVQEMEKQNITRKELADKMGIAPSRLSKLLNTQPNMTLETIAQFELALDIRIDFTAHEAFESHGDVRVRFVPESAREIWDGSREILDFQEALRASSKRGGDKPKLIDIDKERRLAA